MGAEVWGGWVGYHLGSRVAHPGPARGCRTAWIPGARWAGTETARGGAAGGAWTRPGFRVARGLDRGHRSTGTPVSVATGR